MKRIIFLDFDGVLTSESHTRQCIFEYRQENLFGLDWFDPKCIDALRLVVDKTNAQIVISSSWRELGLEKLQHLWQVLNMPGELIDITPYEFVSKQKSIQQWLKDNRCDAFAIIDDDDLGMEYQIQTDIRTGLTDINAKEIINLFK